jgi:peptidoglycan/xylan/chitin deacetylase (PgdA/CDA1 family)
MNMDAVPVLMYHSVKLHQNDSWIHKHITLTLDKFLRHLKLFRILGLRTYFIDDLAKHLKGEKKLSARSIVLTFDDGYTDNWLFVYPLLVKYKMRGTIFVNPEFVNDNDKSLRPNLFDYWNGKISLEELNKYDGFLNWEEMRMMEKSGFIDIQSHTMSHTKHPVSDEIIDFVNPDTKLDWLYWNLFPEDKPNFLTNPGQKLPLGYPIYPVQKGIIAKRVIEDGTIANATIKYVNDSGGKAFFQDPKWKEKLFRVTNYIKQNCTNIFHNETEEEYESRLNYEFADSKRIIEEKLDKKINHLCWPYGGCDQTTINIALKNGYKTTTARGEKNIFRKANFHNADRIALDNPKYQRLSFYPYAIYKFLKYKL